MGRKVTQEEFVEKLKKKNPNLIVIGQYINMKNSIRVKCLKCAYEMDINAGNLLSKYQTKLCPNCSNGRRKIKTKEEYIDVLNSITNFTIKIIGDFNGLNIKSRHKCNVCGYEWETLPRHLIEKKKHSGCPVCSNNIQKTTLQYKKDLQKINSNIIVVGEYINNKTKIEHKCKICKNVWFSTPHNILNGKTGCPFCNFSHGEQIINNNLKNNKIPFIPQYKFENCKNIKPLPFDFYLPDYNICIEFDGIGHFEKVSWNGCDDKQANIVFQNTVKNDAIKTNYCKQNGIKLIRIPYWNLNNIESILDKELEVN